MIIARAGPIQFRAHQVSHSFRLFAPGRDLRRRLQRFLRLKINNANRHSPFAQLTGTLHRLPTRLLLELLRRKGYDGFVYEEKEGQRRFIGSCFFQKREPGEVHIFEFGIEPCVPEKARIQVLLGLLSQLVSWASTQRSIERIFIGVGNNSETRKLYEIIRNHAGRFGVNVIRDGCYEICHPASTPQKT